MDTIQLTPQQITDLARPFVGMLDVLKAFYADPSNAKAYREWHIEQYGCEPKVEGFYGK